MSAGKFVAYYRVSTTQQGHSGLGLDAQREAVMRYLSNGGWPPLAEFTEVETGKGANAIDKRPQLKAALAYARKHKATLLFANISRLARNVHFVSGLMEQGVEIKAADMPNADIFMLQIYAAMAEQEARMTGQRTKAALKAYNARRANGERRADGSPLKPLGANGKVLAAKHKAEAVDRLTGVAGLLAGMRARGLSVRQIAAALNDQAVPSPGGAAWHATTVQRSLVRLGITALAAGAGCGNTVARLLG